jgi:hypothetical protein
VAHPDPLIRKFQNAALQRLESARLLDAGARYLEAIYLAGYVVECALKALILANTPHSERQAVLSDEFKGKIGHNYEHLRTLLKRRAVTIPKDVERAFRQVVWWTVDLRYEVKLLKSHVSEEFLRAAEAIRQWMERSL